MKVLCPRCRSVGRLDEFKKGDRIYLRVVHGRRHCYLGPKDRYIHVEELHEKVFYQPLDLTNILDIDPLDIAINALTLFYNMIYYRRTDVPGSMEKVVEIENLVTSIRQSLEDLAKEGRQV